MSILCRFGVHSAEETSLTYAGMQETQVVSICRRCGRKLRAWVEEWEAGL